MGALFSGANHCQKTSRLILDELTDCNGGNKDKMFIKYEDFSKTAEKFKVSVNTVSNIWKEHC